MEQKISELDGYIFIVQEYNHGFAASLKNAVDSAREEWFDKAAGIVSYGSGGGIRAAEQLRNVLAEQKLPPCGPTQPSTYLLILKVSVPSNPVSTWLRVSMIC